MRKYEYTERQTMAMLGRRGFLKVVGVTALAAGATGYAVLDLLQRRNDIIKARQAGLYKDDKICQANGLAHGRYLRSLQEEAHRGRDPQEMEGIQVHASGAGASQRTQAVHYLL